MPYRIGKNDKGKWCVYNKDTNENKGCSDSMSEASDHMRALYANESKDAELEERIEKALKESEEDEYKHYGIYESYTFATSYAELEDEREARERVMAIEDAVYDMPMLVRNIINDPEIEDKAGAIDTLASELGVIVTKNKELDEAETEKKEETHKKVLEEVYDEPFMSKAKTFLKELLPQLFKEDEKQELMVWKDKDTGQWRWLARYSNNFRDRDVPPEIISANSHRRFVTRVDKGLAPYPELQLWHERNWTIGKATWVAFDEVVGEDVGFAMAAGYFLPGCEQVAEKLSEAKDVKLSHGMPVATVQRDKDDDSIIIEHDTSEVTVLPARFAANEITGFMTIKKEAEMAISDEKRNTLINEWGIKPNLLDEVEESNVSAAAKASDEGTEHKEKNAEDVASVEPTETEGVDAQSADEETETEEEAEEGKEALNEYPTRKEIAEAFVAYLNPYLESVTKLQETVEDLQKDLKSAKKSQEELVTGTIENSSQASLLSMLEGRASGSKEAEVKDGELEDKPAEAKATPGRFGIEFLDNMLSDQPQ